MAIHFTMVTLKQLKTVKNTRLKIKYTTVKQGKRTQISHD